MADQRIPELAPVTVPALTDRTNVRQAGDTRDKFLTTEQILSLVPPQAQGLGNWRYRTETIEPPAAGQLRFNNLDISLATEFYISETNNSGPTDVSTFFDILLVEGAVMFIQNLANAGDSALIELGAVTDEGTYRKVIITSIEEQGNEPANNLPVLVIIQTAAGGGGGGGGFPEFQFFADQMDNPITADWAVNALAPASADIINTGLTVRRFDDTVEEGIGFILQVPAGATNIVFGFQGRAISPQPTPNNIGVNVYNRGLPDDGAVQAWSAGDQLTDLALPNSTNFVVDSESVTLASLGVTAGEVTQFELTRIAPTGGDDQFGDWALLLVKVSFT